MYGIKVYSVNSVGASIQSDEAYYVCANSPSVPGAPILESSNEKSISIAWNALTVINTGGSPITGY